MCAASKSGCVFDLELFTHLKHTHTNMHTQIHKYTNSRTNALVPDSNSNAVNVCAGARPGCLLVSTRAHGSIGHSWV